MRIHGQVAALALFALVLAVACGGEGSPTRLVTVEPLASPTRAAVAPLGGKPAAPPAERTVASAPAATSTSELIEAEDTSTSVASPAADRPSPTPEPPAGPPTDGRWIDVDVTNYTVRLMDGAAVVQTIAPVAVGEQVNTGAYLSTQTGLFHVYSKIEERAYDAPFDAYISHWVGFDLERDNGFHSFLMDETGAVTDARTGRISNGCIRSGEAAAIYAFAEMDMTVWVHE